MDKLYKYVTDYVGKLENKIKWKSVTWTILVLATFLTTYFLILPAIAISDKQTTDAAIQLDTSQTTTTSMNDSPSDSSAPSTVADIITSEVVTEPTTANSEGPVTTVAEQPTQGATTDKKPEVTYFNDSLTFRGSDYTVKVTIPKEAKIPASVKLDVQEIKEQEADYDSYKEKVLNEFEQKDDEVPFLRLYDIRLLVDEEEVEPASSVKVEFSYDTKLEAKDEDVKIVHFKDDGQTEILKSKATKETKNTDSDVAFKTNSFSIYAIVQQDGKEVPRHTYVFQNYNGTPYTFVNNAGNSVSEQIIKDGEELHGVGIPIVDHGQHFNGWYEYNNNTLGNQIRFDEPIPVTENKTIIVRPSMDQVIYLTVYDNTEGTVIFEREQFGLKDGGVTIELSKYSSAINPPTSTLRLVGWSQTKGGAELPGGVNAQLIATSDVSIYPIFKESKRLEFYTNTLSDKDSISDGAPYIAPKFVIVGENATAYKPQEDPKRYGYTFDGWYDNKEFKGDPFDFNKPLAQDTSLYAKWKPANASYTVVYWLQRATDNKNAQAKDKTYDFAGQRFVESAPVGSRIHLTDQDRRGEHINGFVSAGFEYTNQRGETSIEVKADGSSVMNVYFNRKLITMKFYKNTWDIPGRNDRRWTTLGPDFEVYTGLYGTSLKSNGYEWLSPGGSVWEYFSTGQFRERGMSFLGEFILPPTAYPDQTEIRLFKRDTSNTTYRFYTQNIDGSYSTKPTDTGYGRDRGLGVSFMFTEKYQGFKVAQYAINTNDDQYFRQTLANRTTTVYSGQVLNVRYERLKYKLNFLYPDTNQSLANFSQQELYYEAPLLGSKPDASRVPKPRLEGYEWDGKWYKDQTLKEVFDWTGTMPDHDLAVYPGFRKIKYKITLDANGGELGNTQDTHFTLEYGQSVPEYDDITRNYIVNPAGTHYYRKDHLADFSNDGKNQIAHYTQDAAEENVDLTTKYSFDKDAYHLIGWYVVGANGQNERPYNFHGLVTSDLKLRAEWRRSGEYRIVYKDDVYDLDKNLIKLPDGSTLEAKDMPFDANKYDDKSHAELERRPISPDGYRFRGWLYDGKIYNPHDIITIDALKANAQKELIVYPVYKPVEKIQVETTKLIYDGNGGNRKDQANNTVTKVTLDKLPLNTTLTAEGKDYFTRTGYELIGWHSVEEEADKGYIEYNFGQQIGVDNRPDVANTLYAVWKPKEYRVTVTKKVVGNDSDKQRDFSFDPVNVLQQGNFSLKDSASNNNQQKVFEKVPYGTTIAVKEQNYDEFEVVKEITHNDPTTGKPVKTDRVDHFNYNTAPPIVVDGNIDIVFTNTRKTQQVVLKKVSVENTNTGLAGAEFDIYKEENGQKAVDPLYSKVTSGADGTIVDNKANQPFFNLPVGKYLITETKAPNGYNLEKNDLSLVVTATGVTLVQNNNAAEVIETETQFGKQFEFKITNSKGAELPATGGVGEHLYIILGLLIAVPAGLLLYRKQKLKY
ncbi:InlB B-repeat-containing protein [Streptococcus ovis]|uniref:InlB B-repeat-containing protein n=1 Tax=Streptococcus ovis TaxID=82806 RepID=UPI0003817BFB|nr:InlB B-repeat-containing protein [Streptococcus ovis]